MKDNILIDIKDVSFSYNGQRIVDEINLKIKRGEFLGIIGPNGSGKTTLLKIILGLLKPQRGSIQLFGQNMTTFNDWQKIGYVPQKAGSHITHFPITAEEVVAMGRINHKQLIDFTSRADQEATTSALLAVNMENHRKKLLNELSGGQEQRIFIARALVSKPELLILDEPTVGVDIDSQAKFYKLLRDLNKKLQLTLVLVSHDIDVVAHEVDEIACINCKLVCHGKPKDILKSDFMEKLYGKDLRFVIHGH